MTQQFPLSTHRGDCWTPKHKAASCVTMGEINLKLHMYACTCVCPSVLASIYTSFFHIYYTFCIYTHSSTECILVFKVLHCVLLAHFSPLCFPHSLQTFHQQCCCPVYLLFQVLLLHPVSPADCCWLSKSNSWLLPWQQVHYCVGPCFPGVPSHTHPIRTPGSDGLDVYWHGS